MPLEHSASRTPFEGRAAEFAPASSLADDLQQARTLLPAGRARLADEHRIVLRCLLDSKTMLLQFEERRISLVRELLAALEDVLANWLPKLVQATLAGGFTHHKSVLSQFDPIGNSNSDGSFDSASIASSSGSLGKREHVFARCLVQALVGRLGAIHAQVVQHSFPQAEHEGLLEDLNMVVDDLELLLVRATRAVDGSVDDAGHLVTKDDVQHVVQRMQRRCIDLTRCLPGYPALCSSLQKLKAFAIRYGWMIPRDPNAPVEGGADEPDLREDFELIAGNLAVAFGRLSSALLEPRLAIDEVVRLVEAYVAELDTFLQLLPPASRQRYGLAVFWPYQFVLCIIDYVYNSGVEHPLLASTRHDRHYKWTKAVEGSVPAQFEALRVGDAAPETRLTAIGDELIATMRQIVEEQLSQ